ncbi:MAG: hypothetical protein KAJ24_00285, partial [Candidatus Aenigmarchaeota archaeon]|nr:hypothetical protein [Candidatus Aenigmarchaeota archaeon]
MTRMQLPSNKDIEKSIERAEKCLNENDLDVAERECSLAKGLIETRRANQGNDGDSDVVKLNELYGRLTGIMAKSAIERMNQGIRNEPEIELDHKYLSHKLAPIQSELYSKHRELIHKHEYEQAGKHTISERVKDILTGAAKKRSELKESLSKTGYPGVQKIINLTDTLFVETVKERRAFLDKQIQQEITNLPEPYKTAVGSFFREAKKSSVEDKPTSIATEDNPV